MTEQLTSSCGCPIPPEVASGKVESLGWHLTRNHPEISADRVRDYFGNTWVDCVSVESPEDEATVHRFRVNQYFAPSLTQPTHMLVCERCGMHLHAKFEVARRQ
jgi:hypothetical protein